MDTNDLICKTIPLILEIDLEALTSTHQDSHKSPDCYLQEPSPVLNPFALSEHSTLHNKRQEGPVLRKRKPWFRAADIPAFPS